MAKIHSGALYALAESNRTILYGLSLDPLDAELCQILSLGWDSPNHKQIIIINLDHRKVAKRVKLLLNDFDYKIDVLAYDPSDLRSRIQY